MLGAEVVRAAEHANHEVVALTRRDLDVSDAEAVIATIAEAAPGAIVNCAAYTDVDGAEDDLAVATAANVEGARNVAASAAELGATVLYPSTDYVFEGSRSDPYVESDETRPLSVYGQTKLAGELATARACDRHFVVRTAWLFGIEGTSNFVETMLRMGGDHGEVVVVRDQFGCPTWTVHLADALVRLLATNAYGVHHIAGGGHCSWYEFAAEIFAQSDLDCRLISCTSAELARAAPRPPCAILGTERDLAIRLPEWRVGLAGYLAEREAG